MTVSTTKASDVFPGNGLATGFDCEWRIFDDKDVLVSLVDQATGEDTPLVLNSDYTISGAGDQDGFTIGTTSPVATGTSLYARRAIPYTQPTDFTNQGAFYPTMHEDAMDRLEMQIQQQNDRLASALVQNAVTGDYDVGGNRITNMADGTAASDAATVGQVDQKVAASGTGTLPADIALFSSLASTDAGKGASLIGLYDPENWFDSDNLGDAVEALGNNRNFANSKSPLVDWTGKQVLWLGTSIPHQGVGVDGYPELTTAALAATVDNQAWSGSKATYNVAASATDITTVKALSMTEDDRVAGLALYGASSAYSDTFDPITKASQMTCDARIASRFQVTPFDVVVLDHAHNDRAADEGTIAPELHSITGVTLGATTTVTLSSIGTIAVGDAVAIEVSGVSYLNHTAARVQSVAGTTITLNVDSSAYTGTFTSGTCYKLDRSTICGAFEFLIHYVKNAGTKAGVTPTIILAGAPSEFTNGAYDPNVRRTERIIKKVADKWGLSLFNIAHRLDDSLATHITYFTDNVHPLTTPTRQVIANHWVEWLRGGSHLAASATAYLPRGGTSAFVNNREALYSDFAGGFSTPVFVAGTKVLNTSDDFSDGDTTGWTVTGATPTVETAPWGTGKAVKFTSDGSASTTLRKDLTLDKLVRAEFDLLLPATSGLTTQSTTRQLNIATFNTTNSGRFVIYLLVRKTSVSLAARYLDSFGGSYVIVPITYPTLDPNTKYSIAFEVVRGTTGYSGGFIVTVNGTKVSSPVAVADSSWGADVNRFEFGISGPNTLSTLSAYIGNIKVYAAPVSDYSTRFSGTVTGVNGTTLTVVNGVVTSSSAAAATTYTPTTSNVTNVTTATIPTAWQYMRNGSSVTVSGQVQITPTATGPVNARVSLPVASNLAAIGNLAGSGAAIEGTSYLPALVNGDPTTDMANVQFVAGTTAAHNVFVQFTYTVA